MMEKLKRVFIPGIPVTKNRPRHTKNGQTYDPNEQQTEAAISKAQITGWAPKTPFVGALAAGFEFVFPRPKSHFGTGGNSGKLKPSAPKFCTNPLDFDNLEKFYADAFNCILYTDDHMICKNLGSEKRYANLGEYPSVEMIVQALEPEKEHGGDDPF